MCQNTSKKRLSFDTRRRLHPPSHAPRPGTTHGSVPAAFLSADLGPGSSGAHHARGAATAGAVAGAEGVEPEGAGPEPPHAASASAAR